MSARRWTCPPSRSSRDSRTREPEPIHAVAVLLLAVAFDLALGDPPNRAHPVAWLGRALAAGERLLRRGGPRRLLLGGTLTAVGAAALAGLTGGVLERLAMRLGHAGLVVEALGLACLLSLRGLAVAARGVAAALGRGDLPAARAAVGRDLVSRPTAALDVGRLASATIESTAENLTDAFLAPACFFLAFGLAGTAVYRAVNTADAMFGYREGTLEHFGKVAARLDDLLNWIPARLAGWSLVAGAALVAESAARAASVMRRDHVRTASPNAGWTMAAMAGALGVTLEKPGAYRLGNGPLPTVGDIRRALRVFGAGALLSGLAATGAALGAASICPLK